MSQRPSWFKIKLALQIPCFKQVFVSSKQSDSWLNLSSMEQTCPRKTCASSKVTAWDFFRKFVPNEYSCHWCDDACFNDRLDLQRSECLPHVIHFYSWGPVDASRVSVPQLCVHDTEVWREESGSVPANLVAETRLWPAQYEARHLPPFIYTENKYHWILECRLKSSGKYH